MKYLGYAVMVCALTACSVLDDESVGGSSQGVGPGDESGSGFGGAPEGPGEGWGSGFGGAPSHGCEDPVEVCFYAYDDCIQAGVDACVCDAELDVCLEGTWQPEPEPETCEESYDRCIAILEPPEVCAAELEACHGEEPYPQLPCEIDFEACLEAGGEWYECEPILETCPEPEPETCQQKIDRCIQILEPPAVCHARYANCRD